MEDYEKKYKEALERAKKGMPINEVFPELKESEDERIRKFLVDILSSGTWRKEWPFSPADCVAYLEKQKDSPMPEDTVVFQKGVAEGRRMEREEQKSAEWSEDFEDNIRNLLHDKLTWRSEDGSMSCATLIDDKTLKDIVNGIWFYVGKEALKYPNKELSQPKWSEEDEAVLDALIRMLEGEDIYVSPHLAAERLKSLRNRPKALNNWKPSELQMKCLEECVNIARDMHNASTSGYEAYPALSSLYNDLKKLL